MYLTKKQIAEKMGISGVNLEMIISEMAKSGITNYFGRDELGVLKFDYDRIVKFIREQGGKK